MKYTPPLSWEKAMRRAIKEGLTATRLPNGSFQVPSSSGDVDHFVTVDDNGHIDNCSNCIGWYRGRRERPCKHAGIVALMIAREKKIEIVLQGAAR